jgi:large subunit ribosomal protein L24
MAGVHVKKNDTVIVLAGTAVMDRESSGRIVHKRARVIEVKPREGKVLVEGIKKVKRHMRANRQRGLGGGIVERESAIDISNVMVVCPDCGRPTRIRREVGADGRKTRICKRCGGLVDK